MNLMILVRVLPEKLALQDIIVLLTVPAANVLVVQKIKISAPVLVLITAQEVPLFIPVLPDTPPKPSVQHNAVVPVISAWQINLMILVRVLPEKLALQDIIVLLMVPAANVQLVQKMKLKIPVPVLLVRQQKVAPTAAQVTQLPQAVAQACTRRVKHVLPNPLKPVQILNVKELVPTAVEEQELIVFLQQEKETKPVYRSANKLI